ncbi:MAG TPA: TetR/AcrR family transcriptional regulator [Allosphingosinicella sp.]|nr:TetR/AcrR family transcriptional regulator [Allosphingosinicella sp.]
MDSPPPPPGRRGRPPSEAARRAILKAARELLDEGGLLSVTMEGIAARAGVGKPTVYRHWSNRYEVAMAALIDATREAEAPVRPGAPLEALAEQLHRLAELFTSPTGRNVAAMLLSGYGETALSKAFRVYFVQARRDEGRALLGEAVATGQVRADIDLELALDLIYGPVFYRLTMAHAPIDAGFADALLKEVLAGIAAP